MRPHLDYVLVGRRAALTRDFATMLDDLRSALRRLDRQNRKSPNRAQDISSEADTPSRQRRRFKTRDSRGKPPTELNDETLNDDRQPQHHPRRHSVRPRADRLAIFLQRAADGKAARADRPRAAELAKPAPQAGGPAAATTTPQPGTPPRHRPAHPRRSSRLGAPVVSREAAIAANPRIKIETPRVTGSISLKGARIDDLALIQYPRHRRSQIARDRAVLAFAARRTPYYAEFGWVAAAGSTVAAARPEHGVAAGRLGQRCRRTTR